MMTSRLFVWLCANNYLKEAVHIQKDKILSARILGAIRSRDHVYMASLASSDRIAHCTHPDEVAELLQLEAFFCKNPSFSNNSECEAAAFRSFNKAEKLCRITNRRLDHFYHYPERLPNDLRLMINDAIRWIELTLGDFGSFMETIPKRVAVTPGATFDSSRRQSLPYMKVSKRHIHVASEKNGVLVNTLSKYFGYGEVTYKVLSRNRIVTVPKSWKTHRTIACEPTGALPFQLAFDSYVKDRLLRRRIDLRDQTLNQLCAHEGSIDGSFCTIDLSMASDTVSYNTVAWLLPYEWFAYLDSLRSFCYSRDGDIKPYSKFSSMGNGSTFTVETLIFGAFCYAAGSRRFAVYGDDIAIEPQYYSRLSKLLSFFGFQLNTEKSHVSGDFRESCGCSYWKGIDVTPFYLRDSIDDVSSRCHVLNGLFRVSKPYGLVWELVKASLRGDEPLVPYSSDTRCGIHLDPTSCYRRRTIIYNRRTSLSRYRGFKFTPRLLGKKVADSRSLFLWHLRASRRSESDVDNVIRVTVRPSAAGKYKRCWIAYVVRSAMPAYIYFVSDFLLLT